MLAVTVIAFFVKERGRPPVEYISFMGSLRALPANFFQFVVAVGIFGLGDFAHTLLILLATQKLTPPLGHTAAASWAVGLYILHNIFYASFGFLGGWLADHFEKRRLLVASKAIKDREVDCRKQICKAQRKSLQEGLNDATASVRFPSGV